jgi:hypothetical protein
MYKKAIKKCTFLVETLLKKISETKNTKNSYTSYYSNNCGREHIETNNWEV